VAGFCALIRQPGTPEPAGALLLRTVASPPGKNNPGLNCVRCRTRCATSASRRMGQLHLPPNVGQRRCYRRQAGNKI
jgi:hypothetical protein